MHSVNTPWTGFDNEGLEQQQQQHQDKSESYCPTHPSRMPRKERISERKLHHDRTKVYADQQEFTSIQMRGTLF